MCVREKFWWIRHGLLNLYSYNRKTMEVYRWGQKMNKMVGKMIWKLRERLQINQEYLAKGIISASDLSRVELGTKEIDYFELEAIFQRMGKSLDKLELVLSRREYHLLCLREEIEKSFEKQAYEKVEALLDTYRGYNSSKRNVHRQYVRSVKAILQYLKEKNAQEALDEFDACLEITCEKWKETEWA